MSSWYTVFDQKEPTVTTTTTSLLLATDPVLIASGNQKHASQTTVGALASLQSVTTITTLTTGTAIPAYGMSVINTTANGNTVTWTLADPLVAGICKTLFCISTSTTTPVALTIVFNSATGISTDVATGSITSVGFGQAQSPYGGYFELQAQSTSVWAVVGRSAANSRTT